MQIFIPTSGRANMAFQTTLRDIPRTWKAKTSLVVQARQAKDYTAIAKHNGVELIVLPRHIQSISPTRQFILENATDGNILMLDDDLVFYKVNPDDATKYLKAGESDIAAMLKWLHLTTISSMPGKGYAHASVAAREGANRVLSSSVECTRMTRVLAYNVKRVMDCGARFDRIPAKQDFDMTLQLLRAGMKNIVSYEWCNNQRSSNAAGGCSEYRDEAMNEATSVKLAKLHPGFVKVVKKETKTAWGGGERTDVTIQWKRAYESSEAAQYAARRG